jgi:hypothetical protein
MSILFEYDDWLSTCINLDIYHNKDLYRKMYSGGIEQGGGWWMGITGGLAAHKKKWLRIVLSPVRWRLRVYVIVFIRSIYRGAASTARVRVYVIVFISSIYSGAASTARLRSLFHIYGPSFTSTARLRSLFQAVNTLSVVCNMKGSLQ